MYFARSRARETVARVGDSDGKIRLECLSHLSKVWQLRSSQVARPRNFRTCDSSHAFQTAYRCDICDKSLYGPPRDHGHCRSLMKTPTDNLR